MSSDYNYMVDRMCETLAMIELGCLCTTKDKSGKEMGMDHMKVFSEEISKVKQDTLSMDTTSVVEKIKNEYSHIYDISKTIPTSSFLKMARIEKRDKKFLNTLSRKNLQLGFCMCCMWTDDVLKNTFNLRTKKRTVFFERVVDLIYGYQNKMVTMESMNQAFIDDYGYDLINGIEVVN